jgi:hypothetical protein
MAENIKVEQLIEWQKTNKHYIDAYIKAVGTGAELHGEAYDNWKKGQEEYLEEFFEKQKEANKQNWDGWSKSRRQTIIEQSERNKNYTNLIIIAGYAGYFWMWDKVYMAMAPDSKMWSGLMILISIAIFVFSEIFLMWANSTRDIKHFEVDEKRQHDVMSDAKRYDRIENRYWRLLRGVWFYHFIPAVIFGLFAFYFLIEFFIKETLLK